MIPISRLKSSFISVVCSSSFFLNSGFAIGADYEYEYPELLVTPSASIRLNQEAKAESSNRFTSYATVQAASLMVFIAGAIAVNDERLPDQPESDTPMAEWAGLGAMGSGGVMLALTGALSAIHTPYLTGWNKIKVMTDGNKRQKLRKERAAEERLAGAASLSSKIKWISVVMNTFMAGFVIESSENNQTRVAGALAALVSFSPLLFPSNMEKTYDQHQEYKKKIYGPITGAGLLWDSKAKKIAPALTMTWNH